MPSMPKPSETTVGPAMPLEVVISRLVASENVCDQRKGRDLGRLAKLSAGSWKGRFRIDAVAPLGERRALAVIGALGVRSLSWSGGPHPHDRWPVLIGLEHHYPLAMPSVRFVGDRVPYNPHVLHRDHAPDETSLPPELRWFAVQLREGFDGGCCYLESAQWRVAPEFDLALVLWQVSVILTGARIHGERGALNTHARDHYLRLAERGELPLGPPLPAPVSTDVVAHDGGRLTGDDEVMAWEAGHDDVEWTEWQPSTEKQ